jgi:cytidylate kinase
LLDWAVMPQISNKLSAVYVDGETKTGKGAAGQAIATALRSSGLAVYYDIAGDFFRRYVAMARRDLGLTDSEALPIGTKLEAVASKLYASGQLFEIDESLGDLQRPAISESVAILSELALVQKAGGEWFKMSVRQAAAAGASIIVLDGRNPRRRVEEQLVGLSISVHTALDLYMTCEPQEAARRILLTQGIEVPTERQIEQQSHYVVERRNRDRNRSDRPFLAPTESIEFVPSQQSVAEVLEQSLDSRQFKQLPATIILDNTRLQKAEMLSAVSQLVLAAITVTQPKS